MISTHHLFHRLVLKVNFGFNSLCLDHPIVVRNTVSDFNSVSCVFCIKNRAKTEETGYFSL